MSKILGLDLGSNSIGWALVDSSQKKIIGLGCRIFPMGVNLEKGSKEISKNATRREKRQIRRQFFRRKLRKRILTNELMKLGMFPPIKKLNDEIQRIRLNAGLRTFFSINPYECRARAYKGEQLTLMGLGRILYHFAQRRGYKENLQSSGEDEGKIYEGNPEESKTGIRETKEKIKEFGTLGNYLYHEDSHETRLRNRYTTRQMYIDEFEVIWGSQTGFYPKILTSELKEKIGDSEKGILFFYRPLRSQKHLLGKCTFEPTKTKCPASSILFEQFRMYQFINTIKILNDEQRNIMVNLFNSKAKFDFKEVKKKLKSEEETFNYKDGDKVVGNRTISNLRKIFGKDYWDSLTLDEQEKIWNVLYFATDKDWLQNYATSKWNLNEESTKKLLKFRMSKEYSNLSKKAISNILPYLKKGYIYNEAVLLGGIRNAFGSDGWEAFSDKERRLVEDTAIAVVGQKEENGTEIKRIKRFIVKQFKLSEKQLSKLYHHSLIENKESTSDILTEPDNVRNPVVQQVLLELRTLVNVLIHTYGKPDEVKIELARDVKSSKKRRSEYRFEAQQNEKENDEAKKMLDEYGLQHTRSNIQKVNLWKESQKTCPYTGQEIGFADLFNEGYGYIEKFYISMFCFSIASIITQK